MKIKTFYAKSMAAAMQEIKTHFGPEALILSSKEIPSRSGVGGPASGYEVVAASDDAPEQDLLSVSEESAPLAKAADMRPQGGTEPLLYSPASLLQTRKCALQTPAATKRSRRKSTLASPKTATEQTVQDLPFTGSLSISLYQDLLVSGVHEWLARRLVEEAQGAFTPKQRRTHSALLRATGKVVQRLIASPLGQDDLPANRVVAFVGPTGVGKTTTVAKLAARLALKKRKKVVLMTLDGYRIGAVEQLRTYAGLMGIPFRFVSRVSDLPKAIGEHSQRDYILIDTTGRGPRDLDAVQDLTAFLGREGQAERHLVLSATTKSSDLEAIVDHFEVCKPDHLLFTKLDETATLGPILNELVRSRKSLSYYTDGQSVPEDLHMVPKDRLLDIVLNKQ